MNRKLILSFVFLTALALIAKVSHGGDADRPTTSEQTAGGDKEHVEHHSDEVKLTAAAMTANQIRVADVRMEVLSPTFVAPARVSFNAEAMAHVGSVVKGRVIELKVRAGDVVKKDDELLLIESPELGQAQSDLIQKKRAIETASNAIEPMKNAYERGKALFEKSQGIALADVQKREAEFRAAQGVLDAAKASASAAENTLHLLGMGQAEVDKLISTGEISPQFAIKAPIQGQVIEREVTLGELVSPEKETLLVLANTDSYWVLADVPEARLAALSLGAKAVVEVSALKGERFEGTVSYIAPSVDAETRSVRVRIEVKNGHTALRPGMFAKAFITLGASDAKAVLAVPEEAVQEVEGAPSVFVPVAEEENTFAKRSVTVGKAVGGMVPILSGLKAGESVVVNGSFILKADLGKSSAKED